MTDLKRLETMLFQGKITRREFLARVSALGISVTLSPLSLNKKAHAVAPKKGGRLRAALSGGSTSNTLDPAISDDIYTSCLFWGTLHNYLTEINNDGRLIGELAESFEASDNAKKWVFRLRKGVEFHNGKTMDAKDVLVSMNHHRGPDTKSFGKSLVASVEDIKTPDKYTVIFELNSGNMDFPWLLSERVFAIMPEKDGKPDWESGIGTGGYILRHFEPGVRTELKRNPNYWKAGRAHFDEVEFLSIQDMTARTSALRSGKVDLMDRCDLKTLHLLENMPGLRVEETVGTMHYTLPMNTTAAPFDDNNIRLALKHAIDRKAIVKTVLRGHGMVGNDHPIAPANQFYAADLPQLEYDPDKAKHYLKKAGHTSFKVNLSSSEAAFPGAVDTAILYKEHAKACGIDINVIREPSDGFWSDVWMKKPFTMCYWAGRPTEDWMYRLAYSDDATWNDTFWKHERFNKILREARTEIDQNKRREMYYESQKILRDEGGVIIPMFANHVWAVSDKIQHDEKVAANQSMDGARCAERWWFKA